MSKDFRKQLERITPMENEVLFAIIDHLYAEPGFSDVDINDVVGETGFSAKTARGCIASLIKKGFITEGSTYDPMFKGIYYLNEEHYNLHPEWGKEISEEEKVEPEEDINLVKAQIVVFSHLSDMQESGRLNPTSMNFVKYIISSCNGDLNVEINPYTLYEEFKQKHCK